MGATVALALPEEAPRPDVEVFRFPEGTLLAANGVRGRVLAYLRERERRLFINAYRHALDARTMGGMSSLIELADLGADLPVRFAVAVRVTADMRGVQVEWRDRDGRPLAALPFGGGLFAQVAADAGE